MRLKVQFYGFALALIGFLIPLVALAALLPYLINAEPVKKRFIQELQSWTGAEVRLGGPVAIESFFSLSLNAQDVEFGGFKGFPSVKTLRAGQVIARIAWTDLLFGNLDFDKLKLDDAVIRLSSISRADAARVLGGLLAAAHNTPFEAFVLQNSQIEIGGETALAQRIPVDDAVVTIRGSERRIEFGSSFAWNGEPVRIEGTTKAIAPGEQGARIPLRLDLTTRLLTGSFDGEAALPDMWNAVGQLSAATPDGAALVNWFGLKPSTDLQGAFEVSGGLDLSSERIQLQSASFSAAGQAGSGEVTVVLSRLGPQVEGSLAFEELNLSKIWAFSVERGAASTHAGTVFADALTDSSLDLRVSANRMRWNAQEMGTAAFALTGRGGALAAEIARLDLFGGSFLGHIDLDLRGDIPHARARLTGENVDAALLMAAASDQEWLTGLADADIQAEVDGRTDAELVKSARVKARVAFPEGGRMRLDLARLAERVTVQGVEGWDQADLSWWSFDDLRFDLSLQNERMRCAGVTMLNAGGSIHGNGEIDLGAQKMDWQLQVQRGAAGTSQGSAGGPAKGAVPRADLSIEGPWAKPAIRLGRKSSSAPAGRAILPRNQKTAESRL